MDEETQAFKVCEGCTDREEYGPVKALQDIACAECMKIPDYAREHFKRVVYGE